jgi:citrate synthase
MSAGSRAAQALINIDYHQPVPDAGIPDGWIDAKTAADRLGVRPATLYSYVSRGVLVRRYDPSRRRSLFDPAEVERLARRGRPRRRPAPTEIAVRSAITVLGADRPYYRGRDALDLAVSQRFESVAEWLWTGEMRAGGPWAAPADAVAAARATVAGLPGDLLPLDLLPIIVSALAVTSPARGVSLSRGADSPRSHRVPAAVVETHGVAQTGRDLIAGVIEALPALSSPVDDSVAARLWSRLAPQPPPGVADLKVLDAAMILLADHELAASTFAARVAASVHADPFAVVSAGLGVLSGAMHGGASLAVERLLADIERPADVPVVLGERLRRRERIPGAGHSVYKSGDGRGILLFDLVRKNVPNHPKVAVAEAILTELRIRRLPAHNIDFALAVLGAVYGLIPGAGEAIFACARIAGWLAHAMEEYETRSPLRPRAIPAVNASVPTRFPAPVEGGAC